MSTFFKVEESQNHILFNKWKAYDFQISVSINKVVLAYSVYVLFMALLGGYCNRVEQQKRPYGLESLKYYLVLYRKLSDPSPTYSSLEGEGGEEN